MDIITENHLKKISSPANLLINDEISKFRKICAQNGCVRPYHHFAFGQSPFPPAPEIIDALRQNSGKHSYLPTAGIPELRQEVAGFYKRKFSLDFEPGQIVVSPGSKEMISIILAALEGTVIVPTPAWVSYLPQAHILKKQVIPIRTARANNYKLSAELLDETLHHNRVNQKILIFNQPNNPTGVIYSKTELEEIAQICRDNNVVLISDEIYALTSFDETEFTSMASVFPEGTIVTGGLSKDRSCGGYRLGVGIFPKESPEVVENILKIAGSTYSCVAAPIQYAAVTAYSDNKTIDNYIDDCRRINTAVGNTAFKLLNEIPGIKTSEPRGAFYIYVDFNSFKDNFKNIGINTCAEFCKDLLLKEHTALLPGNSLLLPDDDFSVRCSFVDYDGAEVLSQWRSEKPVDDSEIEKFVEKNCSLVVDGIGFISRYLDQIREYKAAVHF